MKQQTAVEWLKQQLETYGDPQYCELKWEELDSLINQAKEMEKNQMIEFAQEVFRNRYNQISQSLGNIADDIYNETYNKNK